jgi:Zn-dependent protease
VPLFDPVDSDSSPANAACVRCGTELAPLTLACPSCGALVHKVRLQELAEQATAAVEAGDAGTARLRWQDALTLVPASSEQHRLISQRIERLQPAPDAADGAAGTAPPSRTGSWGKQAIGVAVTLGILLATKAKFLLLGLTKISTFTSMFGFIAVYWALHGWPLALGLGVSIYIHEMGHVWVLRRLGIHAGAPLFIPGVGAVVMLKERITDPIVDARIGLAGPIWGMGAALAAWLVGRATGAPIWMAIAELTAFLNLFNLTPVWQLDGSRGFNAMSMNDRWVAVAAIGLMGWLTGVGLLWILGIVAVWRALSGQPGPGHERTIYTYVGLVVVLSLLARNVQ